MLQYVLVGIVATSSIVFLPLNDNLDKLVYGVSADGEYFVKYEVAITQNGGLDHVPPHDNCLIWKLKVSLKIKFFLWKIIQDSLPTKKRLEMSYVFLPLKCVFCNFHSEDTSHLFANCPFCSDVFEILTADNIIHAIPQKIEDTCFNNYLFFLLSSISCQDLQITAIFWWLIWYARDSITFREESFSPHKVCEIVKVLLKTIS